MEKGIKGSEFIWRGIISPYRQLFEMEQTEKVCAAAA